MQCDVQYRKTTLYYVLLYVLNIPTILDDFARLGRPDPLMTSVLQCTGIGLGGTEGHRFGAMGGRRSGEDGCESAGARPPYFAY